MRTFVRYIPSALSLFRGLPGPSVSTLFGDYRESDIRHGTVGTGPAQRNCPYKITECTTDERSNRCGCFGPPMFGMMPATCPDLLVVDRESGVDFLFCSGNEHCLSRFGSNTESMVAQPISYYLDCGISEVLHIVDDFCNDDKSNIACVSYYRPI